MSVVKLNKDKQKKLKRICKSAAILSKICRIIIIILIPIMVLGMIGVGIIINKTDTITDGIKFEGFGQNIAIIKNYEALTIVENGNISEGGIKTEIGKVIDLFNNHSKSTIMFLAETYLLFSVIACILSVSILKSMEKLFKNIYKEETPFIIENIKLLKKIGFMNIISIAILIVANLFLNIFIDVENDNVFNVIGIIDILFVYALVYIFEYGYELQQESKAIIYGEEK